MTEHSNTIVNCNCHFNGVNLYRLFYQSIDIHFGREIATQKIDFEF